MKKIKKTSIKDDDSKCYLKLESFIDLEAIVAGPAAEWLSAIDSAVVTAKRELELAIREALEGNPLAVRDAIKNKTLQ